MNNFAFLNGNEAVAVGVKLSRPHVIAAYPITPQTKAVEKLSQYVQDGEMTCKYMHVESEHSAMACSIGASSVGARTFTATSSQGLLYMAECLPYAAGARLPIVMMNANRALATPWNIYGDQMDTMFLLNSGWVQLFVEDAQEALDMVIQSYRLAEHETVMAPVMLNLDGFVLTHTYEKVEVPSQDEVDAFLPPIKTAAHMMSDELPMSMCISAGNQHNMEFKIRQHQDLFNAESTLNAIDQEFAAQFGRGYHGAVEGYLHEDAELLLITLGSVTGTARLVVDALREKGEKVGLIKLRMIRPFPVNALSSLCQKARAIGVIDRNISFGYEGTVFTNVNSALLQTGCQAKTLNFIGGLGGRDITQENITDMFRLLKDAADEDTSSTALHSAPIHFSNVRCSL